MKKNMKKVVLVLLAVALSLSFLVGCQSKGECSQCGENGKLYYISEKIDGEEQNEDQTPLYCKDCAKEIEELGKAFGSLMGDDYKIKAKKYRGEVE